MQDKGGYLRPKEIKNVLFKFVNENLRNINIVEIRRRLMHAKEEATRLKIQENIKNEIQE